LPRHEAAKLHGLNFSPPKIALLPNAMVDCQFVIVKIHFRPFHETLLNHQTQNWLELLLISLHALRDRPQTPKHLLVIKSRLSCGEVPNFSFLSPVEDCREGKTNKLNPKTTTTMSFMRSLWPFIASNRRNGESKQRELWNLEDSKVVCVSVCLHVYKSCCSLSSI
jgi:hypothetical protein